MTAAQRQLIREAWSDHCRSLLRFPVQCANASEYNYKLGCRCHACCTAMRDSKKGRRRDGDVRTHSYAGYSNGCRCTVCKADHRRYQNAHRAKLRAG